MTTHDVGPGLAVDPSDKQDITVEGNDITTLNFSAVALAVVRPNIRVTITDTNSPVVEGGTLTVASQNDTDAGDGSGPGFGVFGAIAGLLATVVAVARRFSHDGRWRFVFSPMPISHEG